MRRMLGLACCMLSLAIPAFGQTRSAEPLAQRNATPPYQHPVAVARPYPQTWYDALLRQFNPDNLDWGHWLEQRRENLLEQTAANPYFKYSLVTTTLLMLFAVALAKLQIDKSRIKWLAAERHEDLLRHDSNSRQIAYETIRKYNDHMEKCNRVVEAEVAGRSVVAPTPLSTFGTTAWQQVLEEKAQLKREREQLQAELEINKAMVNDLTLRINAFLGGGNGSAQDSRAQGDVLKQLNELREKLYRERERNRQLKGM